MKKARYMADYKIYNMTSYVLAHDIFGNLQHFWDIESGKTLFFILKINFDLGEVIDASPPVSHVYEMNMEVLDEEGELAMVALDHIEHKPIPKMQQLI